MDPTVYTRETYSLEKDRGRKMYTEARQLFIYSAASRFISQINVRIFITVELRPLSQRKTFLGEC